MATEINTYWQRTSDGGNILVEEAYDDVSLLWVNGLQGNRSLRITNNSSVVGTLVVKLHLPDGRIVSTDALRVPRGAAAKSYNVNQMLSATSGTLDLIDKATGAVIGTVSGLMIRGPIDYTGVEVVAP